MSAPQPANKTGVVVAIVAVFAFTIAGVIGIAVAVPEGANPGSLITLLLGSLAPTIAAVVAVVRLGAVDDKVDDLGNGLMDAKLRAAVADVVKPQHIRPEMNDQLAVDRARRAAGHRRRRPSAPDPILEQNGTDLA